MMRRLPCAWTRATLLGWMVGLAAPPLYAQSPNVRMQSVLARFVEQTGQAVLGVGSWISGQGFNPATSDFDMRLVVVQGGSEAEHLARWQKARAELAALITKEFGRDAASVLSRTNLYAPNQLMAGIEDAEDALGRFVRLGTVPNLGYAGRVTAATPVKYVEGLYGAGAQTYIEAYERAAGRLFYNSHGKCVVGLSELTHLGLPESVYTAAGTASTAGQWAEHALVELQEGRGDKVAKYLERLERDLVKSRSLSGLPVDEAFRQQLKEMVERLRKSPLKLSGAADDVAKLIARGRTEAAVLGSFAKAGPMRQAYLRVMLDGVAAGNTVGRALDRIMAKLPNGADAENTMGFIVFCLGTQAAAQSFGQGDDFLETMSKACGALNPFKLIGPTLLAEVMAEILVQAKAGGYDLAAGFQGAWDLMEGIYTAWGRAGVDLDPRCKFTLADLVATYQDEERLAARVMTQAVRAATRGLGSANEEHDAGVAQAIFDQCWPTIRDAWRWERDVLTSEFLTLASEIAHTPLLIGYQPTGPTVGERVGCEAVSADQKLSERLQRMRQIIRILYAAGSGVAANFYWEPAGEAVAAADWQRSFRFDKVGRHPVKVRLEVAPFTRHTGPERRVMLRRVVPALVEVDVGKPDGPPGPGLHLAGEYPLFWPLAEYFKGFEKTGVGVRLTARGSLVLQAAGMAPSPAMIGEPTAWGCRYTLAKGRPCHLALDYAYVVSSRQQKAFGTDLHILELSCDEPKVVLVVAHEAPGVATTKQEVAGPTYTLDFRPAPGETYTITAYALLDFKGAHRGSQVPQPYAEAGQARRPVATITLECPK